MKNIIVIVSIVTVSLFKLFALSNVALAQPVPKKLSPENIISKAEFLLYKDVGEFIDHSPKVTLIVPSEANDVAHYGKGVVKSLTGSDCDRDGKMDDNATCNAFYVKLWLKYQR